MKANIAVAVLAVSAAAWADAPSHGQGPKAYGSGLDDDSHFMIMSGGFHQPRAGDVLKNNSFQLKVQKRCEPAGDLYPPNIPAYRCYVTSNKPICRDALDLQVETSGVSISGSSRAARPIVVVRGYWKDNTTYVNEDLTAGCSVDGPTTESHWKAEWASALAKCVERWKMNGYPDLLRACVHMARAAYLGDSRFFTHTGTPVDAWDLAKGTHYEGEQHLPGCQMISLPAYQAQRDAICAMWFEAEWDNKGATCINHVRWLDLDARAQTNFVDRDVLAEEMQGLHLRCRNDVILDRANDKAPIVLNVIHRKGLLRNRSELHLYSGQASPHPPPPFPTVPCSNGGTCAKMPGPPRESFDVKECRGICGP